MHRFVFGTAMAAVALAASAQDYPSRTVTIVAPCGAGSPTEQEARKLGAHDERVFKRPVIVENRPGAGARFGAAHVANAVGLKPE